MLDFKSSGKCLSHYACQQVNKDQLSLAGSSICCLLGHLQPWQSAPIPKVPEWPILARRINDAFS